MRENNNASEDGGANPSQKVILAGTLFKKHANSKLGIVGKNYDKRFFVLTHDTLIYRHSPINEDPNEKTFEIRHLMSVTKLGSRSIELRFTERTLVIKCTTDEEYERWFKALDLVRFQPLPYEVQNKEVPVPQIVPPIVPRLPVDEAEAEDDYRHSNNYSGGGVSRDAQARGGGSKRSPSRGSGPQQLGQFAQLNQQHMSRLANASYSPSSGPQQAPLQFQSYSLPTDDTDMSLQQQGGSVSIQGPSGPGVRGVGGGRMRTSSLLEKEIADRIAQSGVDPLLPPKFLKRLSQGSLDVMMTGQGQTGGSNNPTNTYDASLGGMVQYAGGRGGASTSSVKSSMSSVAAAANANYMSRQAMAQQQQQLQQAAAPIQIQLTSGGRRMAMHSQEQPASSPTPSPPLARIQPTQTLQPSNSTRANMLPLPLPDLPTGELSPRSKLAKGAAAASFMLNGTLPSDEPSPALDAAATAVRGQGNARTQQPTAMGVPRGHGGLQPLAGRLSDDGDVRPPASHVTRTPPRREGDMLTFTDEEDSFLAASTPTKAGGVQPAKGGQGAHRLAGAAGPTSPLDKSSLELILQDESDILTPPRKSGAAGRQAKHDGGDWLDEDFDSEEEDTTRRAPPVAAAPRPQHAAQSVTGGQPPRAQGNPRQSASSGNLVGQQPEGASRVVPRPPGGPKPQESFSRPVVPQAPASRPESTRAGSDFRRRAAGGAGPVHSAQSQPNMAPPPPPPAPKQVAPNSTSTRPTVPQTQLNDLQLEESDWDD